MAKIGDHENQLRALREAKLKSSRGGVESRHTVQRSAAKPGNTGIITSQSEQSEGRGRSGPQTSRRSAVDDGIHQTPAGVASGPREAKRKTGRPLAKGEIVHHLNTDETDDRPENLVVVLRPTHAALHKQLETISARLYTAGLITFDRHRGYEITPQLREMMG